MVKLVCAAAFGEVCLCLGLVGLSFGGRQTCLLVVVFMRSDFFHRVVLDFDVDEIFISDVILVHALSSEWMVAGSIHDLTKIALLRACWQTCCVAHMTPASRPHHWCRRSSCRRQPATITLPAVDSSMFSDTSVSTSPSIFTAHLWHVVRDVV